MATAHLNDTFLSMVLDRTSDGIVLANAGGTIVYVNQPLLEMFGYAAGDVVGRPVEMLMPEDLRASHRKSLSKYAKAPRPRPMGREDLDIEGKRADGSHFPIDVQLNPIPDSSLVVATVRDMTEHRHLTADRALVNIDLARARAENDRLRRALDLIIQRLFGLGMLISATASNSELVNERMIRAVNGIDEIIEDAQRARQVDGP